MHKQMPYEVLVQVFLIQGIGYRQVLKQKILAWHVLLLYQNVNKEIINFTIQNVSGRFRTVYYTPGLLFWGVFYDNCGKITYSENIYMQGRTIMIAPRKIKHMAEKMERENLEFRTFLKCSADEKN